MKVSQIPSHWRPEDTLPTDNVAIGAKWQAEDGTALLSVLYAQQPTQPMVNVKTEESAKFLQFEAHADNWVIKALARPHVGLLAEGEVEATAQLLVTCREFTGGKVGGLKWIYVWGAAELKLPLLDAAPAKNLRRGLLLWDGKAWQIPPTADGT